MRHKRGLKAYYTCYNRTSNFARLHTTKSLVPAQPTAVDNLDGTAHGRYSANRKDLITSNAAVLLPAVLHNLCVVSCLGRQVEREALKREPGWLLKRLGPPTFFQRQAHPPRRWPVTLAIFRSFTQTDQGWIGNFSLICEGFICSRYARV